MMFEQAQNKEVMNLYAAIAKQSEVMLESAKASDWEGLCAAEEQCSKLISELQSLKQASAQLNDNEKQAHIGYLKKILA
ncbi:MAG: flagellar protein FliT, partial [Limnobacter sp.]|nr:flagellar protein FliT [Limnobacter sp.]